ncbi:tetratricopeptide repeat protein [Elusimicrobiota bacterium]
MSALSGTDGQNGNLQAAPLGLPPRAIGIRLAQIEPPKPQPQRRRGHALKEFLAKGRRQMRLFDTEGYELAVASFLQILDEAPGYGPAHAGLAEAYSYWGFRREINGEESQSYYALSLEHAEKAVDLAPDLGESHRALAVALRRGEHANAERRKEEVLIALDLDPNSAENWYEYWRAFGYQPHDTSIQRALELDPRLCAAEIDLGVVLCERDRLHEAARHLGKALEINPRNSLASYNLVMVLDRQGKGSAAREVLDRAREAHPNDPLITWATENFGGYPA